jgi:hypothetical protein
MVSFTNRPLYCKGKSPWYPLDRRLGGFQDQSGHSGEEKNFQPLPGLEPSVIKPIAQICATKLSRLLLLLIGNYEVGAVSIGMMPMPSFVKFHQLVQKLLGVGRYMDVIT